MSTVFATAILVALLVGIVRLFWLGIKPYVKIIKGDKPKPETCTAKQEMEHYQTLLDEWEPVEGSPLHDSLVQAIADAQVRVDAATSDWEWQARIKDRENQIFRLQMLNLRHWAQDADANDVKIAELNRNIEELKARRDKARQHLANTRR